VPDDDRYSLTELADLAGVTPRTVRYYLAQGLLPAVGQSGPGSKYGMDHLLRLRLIRRLQAEHLPLAEIRRQLDGLSDAEIRSLSTADEPAPPTDSALDYVRTILGGAPRPEAKPIPIAVPASPAMTRPLASRTVMPPVVPSVMREERTLMVPPAASEIQPGTTPATLERSQWERIALAPDVELHIRRPLTRIQQKGIDRLVTIARELLEEDRS